MLSSGGVSGLGVDVDLRLLSMSYSSLGGGVGVLFSDLREYFRVDVSADGIMNIFSSCF